jgi:hypothetical protein
VRNQHTGSKYPAEYHPDPDVDVSYHFPEGKPLLNLGSTTTNESEPELTSGLKFNPRRYIQGLQTEREIAFDRR